MKNYYYLSFFVFFLVFISCENEKNNNNQKATSEKLVFVKKPPINGTFYGIVELGAAGFNSFIIEADKDLNWKLNHREYGASLLVEGMTNTMLVSQKLQEYVDSLLVYGLIAKNIYFVVSSGAIKEDLTKFIVSELEKLGHKVNIVTPEEEGIYALKAILPEQYKRTSYVVDMGSGNTKIAYFKDDNNAVSIETEGAKYYQRGMEDEEVYKEVRNEASKIPMERRQLCFIIGGVPTKMANHINKDSVLLTALNTDVHVYKDIKGKKVASGVNIFKAIQDETKVKEVFYFLDGNFAVGFLLDKIK